MSLKREFEMTDAQLAAILDASKPTPLIFSSSADALAGRSMFGSSQENAERAWQRLGAEMGFVWETVEPSDKGERFFLAESKP